MARIRTVKPDFTSDAKVARLSRDARLTFLLMFTEADDDGRMVGTAKRLAGALYPHDDDVTPRKLNVWVAELVGQGMVQDYTVDGIRYLFLVNFTKHQKIDHKTDSRLPEPPPKDPGGIREQSANGSLGDSEPLAPDLGSGSGSGLEVDQPPLPPRTDSTVLAIPADRAPTAPGSVERVFQAWCKSTGKHPGRTKLDQKRRRIVAKALVDYPIEDLIDAVDGWKQSPHHRGDNDQRTVYNDLGLLLRDSAHIEKFRDLARATGRHLHALPARYDVLNVLDGIA